MEKIINSLKMLNFTEYESKVYLTLLKNEPSNGNNIAKLSGVPSPKVYSVLQKMKEEGTVFAISSGNSKHQVQYRPLPYKKLLETKESSFINNLKFLDTSFEEISSHNDMERSELFVIEDYNFSIATIQNSIENSNSNIILSYLKKEYVQLEEQLIKAYKRVVTIITLIFDDVNIDVPWSNFFHYKKRKVIEKHIGELSVVIDNEKSIVLQADRNQSHAVMSSHPITVITTK